MGLIHPVWGHVLVSLICGRVRCSALSQTGAPAILRLRAHSSLNVKMEHADPFEVPTFPTPLDKKHVPVCHKKGVIHRRGLTEILLRHLARPQTFIWEFLIALHV